VKIGVNTLLALLVLYENGHAQGFVNLDFEQGYTISNGTVTIPDWVASAPYVTYDSPSLSGGSISICESNAFGYTIQGNFFILMAGVNLSGYDISISLGQTGQIPLLAQSITFWGDLGNMQITFNGQPLSFYTIGTTANYDMYEANVSAYASQTGQLLFTLPPLSGNATLDNIQFSSTPVPEPGALALSSLGGLLLVWRGSNWHFSRRASASLRGAVPCRCSD
jgi:hypothetical protein